MCACACTGEVISEGTEETDETGYHADRDDIVHDEGHVATDSTKGKAEVQVSAADCLIMLCCFYVEVP